MRKDKSIVLTSVSNEGYALRFAGPELKKQRDVVLAAVG